MNWLISKLCRWLTRKAAKHLLHHFFPQWVGGPVKSTEDILVEAFLWDAFGDPNLGNTLRRAVDWPTRCTRD